MTVWTEFAADYIRLRRQLGADLRWPEHLLGQFCAELDAAGCKVLTVDVAIAWCSVLPEGVTVAPLTRATTRMRTVRGFATYLHALNPAHEVPPPGMFPYRAHPAYPHIYEVYYWFETLVPIRNLVFIPNVGDC
jgi:integrase/recombinase XerD